MCLAVPARVIKIDVNSARVDVAGIVRNCNVQLLPEVKVGDYVLLHAGFAIEKIDEAEAKETLRIIAGAYEENDEIH